MREANAALSGEVSTLRGRLAAVRIASILIVSIPKSGTVYTNRLLSQGLGLRDFPISLGYFPTDLIDHQRLREFANGGCVSSAHLDPSDANLQMLSCFVPKWTVHMRDPRSVVLSWTHHVHRYAQLRPELLLNVCPVPPREYVEWPFEHRLWWNLHNFLPAVVSWSERWLAVIDSGRFQIKLTTYDELLSDESEYVRRILAFHGIPEGLFLTPQLEKSIDSTHFRTGRRDEWRDVFSADQLAFSNKTIGATIMGRLSLVE